MSGYPRVSVIIPALNEAAAIGRMLKDFPWELVSDVVVVDNGSTDKTAETAGKAGARVVFEPEKGYGRACLRGLAAIADVQPDVVVFMDGDYSDDPREIQLLIDPIVNEGYDLVLGSRIRGSREKGALPVHAIIANRVFAWLVRLFYGPRLSDIGSYKAIRYSSLTLLNLGDRGYGFPIELVVKSSKKGLKIGEVPTSFRKRIGESKVTGNLTSSIKAGVKIMYVIFKHTIRG